MKTHTEFSNEQSLKKYKCDKCPFETHKSYNLNKHKKLHDEVPLQSPEEIIYKCDKEKYTNSVSSTKVKLKNKCLNLILSLIHI